MRLLARLLLVSSCLLAMACSGSTKAANDAAMLLDQRYATALSIGRAVAESMPTFHLGQGGAGTLKEKMSAYAGANRFANRDLGNSRNQLISQARGNYQRLKQGFRNSQFEGLRTSLRGGSDVPSRGSVRDALGVFDVGPGFLAVPKSAGNSALKQLLPAFAR